MTGRMVLALDDGGGQVAIGPVCTQRSLDELRREITGHGWTVTAVVPHYSRAELTYARAADEGYARGGQG